MALIVQVENINGVLVTTSNRVAEELGVNHRDLLEKIDGYVEKFTKAESSALVKEFYIPSFYKVVGNFKEYRNYLITKKGIAQLVGGYSSAVEKAFDLNVAYINKFEEMENKLQDQEAIANQELLSKIKKLENKVNPFEDDWALKRIYDRTKQAEWIEDKIMELREKLNLIYKDIEETVALKRELSFKNFDEFKRKSKYNVAKEKLPEVIIPKS